MHKQTPVIPARTTCPSLGLALFLSVSGLALAACSSKKAEKPEATVLRVEVDKAKRHTFRGVLPITGELRPIHEVTLKSRVGGNVVELNFDEGDQVKKGQLIARIEDHNQQASLRGARAAVQLAEAQVERAKADLERLTRDKARIESLYSRGAIDKKAVDDIQTGYRLAQAGIRTAEAQLSQAEAGRQAAGNGVNETQYRAPFDGVISKRGVSLHEYIDTFKNRDIVSLVDNSSMELVAVVPADLGALVLKGAQVQFQVGQALSKEPFLGEVVAVNPSADPRTRTIRLRARLKNEKGLLKGGMYATGVVTIGGERVSVGVPQEAIRKVQGGPTEGGEGPTEENVVWRIKDGKAERIKVTLGVQDGDLLEVVTGLSVDDQVVVSSPAGLSPGLPVAARPRG